MRALEGREEPGNCLSRGEKEGARGIGRRVPEGTSKKEPDGQEGLGSESSGRGKEGSSGEESPGKDSPRRRARRDGRGGPWREKDPELERRETLVRKGETVHSRDEFPVRTKTF